MFAFFLFPLRLKLYLLFHHPNAFPHTSFPSLYLRTISMPSLFLNVFYWSRIKRNNVLRWDEAKHLQLSFFPIFLSSFIAHITRSIKCVVSVSIFIYIDALPSNSIWYTIQCESVRQLREISRGMVDLGFYLILVDAFWYGCYGERKFCGKLSIIWKNDFC